mgnify:CR=1 FL=1
MSELKLHKKYRSNGMKLIAFTIQEFTEFQHLYEQSSPFVSNMFEELKNNPKSYRALNTKLSHNSTIETDLENESNLIYAFQNYNENKPSTCIQIMN